MDLVEHLLAMRQKALLQKAMAETTLSDVESAIDALRATEAAKLQHAGTRVNEAIVTAIGLGKTSPRAIHHHLQQIGIDTTVNSIRTLACRLHAQGRIGRSAAGWAPRDPD